MTLEQLTQQGWRIEAQAGNQVTLVRGKRVNHLLHFFLMIFTVGFWIPVWILISMTGGEKHRTITVDPPR